MPRLKNWFRKKYLSLNFRLGSGVHIEIHNRMEWIIYNDIFVEGDYDEAITRLLSRKESTLHVVDLGSNVGFFLLRLADLTSKHDNSNTIRIHAVEGSTALCKESTRRLGCSQLPDHFHVDVCQGLIGSRDGKGILFEFDDHGLNSVFRASGHALEANYIDLSQVFRAFDEIHLLKCDIEGSELLFIQNYPEVLKKTKAAVFEFHYEMCSHEECIHLLQQAGFVHREVIKQHSQSSVEYFYK